jgi:hypothetical protein
MCPGWRYYEPADLQRLLGDIDANAVERRMKCERCGKGDSMQAEVLIPVAAERTQLTMQRLVTIKSYCLMRRSSSRLWKKPLFR